MNHQLMNHQIFFKTGIFRPSTVFSGDSSDTHTVSMSQNSNSSDSAPNSPLIAVTEQDEQSIHDIIKKAEDLYNSTRQLKPAPPPTHFIRTPTHTRYLIIDTWPKEVQLRKYIVRQVAGAQQAQYVNEVAGHVYCMFFDVDAFPQDLVFDDVMVVLQQLVYENFNVRHNDMRAVVLTATGANKRSFHIHYPFLHTTRKIEDRFYELMTKDPRMTAFMRYFDSDCIKRGKRESMM